MPTYEYACRSCGSRLEVVQSFTDEALTTCGECGGPLRKVFGSVGISFKGSGFYKTDSRAGSSSTSSSASRDDGSPKEAKEPAAAKADTTSTSTSGDGGGSSAATPAPKPAAPASGG